MRKALLILLTLLLASACSEVSGQPPEHYLDRAETTLIEARGDSDQIAKVLEIYEEGLEKYPNDPELLRGHAQTSVTFGQYEDAKNDMDTLYETGNIHNEGRLFRCMLHERLNGAIEKTLACYEATMNAFATASEARETPDANHVLAAYLARSPEAEDLLKKWKASDDPMKNPMLEAIFKDLDRQELIEQFLP